MAISFGLFHDSALTNPIEAGDPLAGSHVAGVSDYTDATIYFGSAAAATQAQVAASPGVDEIVVSVVDADGATGAPATEFRLSLSPITGAETPGAALTLSTSINSGVANAVPIYTRRTSAIAVVGVYEDISLATQALIEVPV